MLAAGTRRQTSSNGYLLSMDVGSGTEQLRHPEVRIGISGWRYAPWRGVFYPPGLAQARELEYASRRLNSIEINGSFYSFQRPSSYLAWVSQAPPGFVFSVKGSRFISHLKKLADVRVPLANFFASGVLALGPSLGPILWQLPPNLGADLGRLETFLRLLPPTTGEAVRLAAEHDDRLGAEGQTWLTTDEDRRIRYALEVRHGSFRDMVTEVAELLRAYGIGLVVADTAGRWPYLEELTTDFVYVRLHGDEELYVSGYDEAALDRWAGKVRAWTATGRDVYVYFDNDTKVRAPFDAMALAERLGVLTDPAVSEGR